MGIKALIAAGSNQGDSDALLRDSFDRIGRLPATSILATSTLRRTAPVGPASRPFVNACLLVETQLEPQSLLDQLLFIESCFGRNRGENSGTGLVDRPLDLDIVLYGDAVLAGKGLVIPHPRMSFRRFVLEPAAEVAGDMRHPLFAGNVRHFLDCINDEARRIVVAGATHARERMSFPVASRWSVVRVEHPGAGAVREVELPPRMNLLIEFAETPASPAGLSFPGWSGPRWQIGSRRNEMSPDEFAGLIRTAAESMREPDSRHASG